MRMQFSISVLRTVFAVCIAMLSAFIPLKAQVYVGGLLTSNDTYSPDNNPYIVTQDLIVAEGVTLTLLPGVEMYFEFGTSLVNNGTLVAKGSVGQKISFLPKNQQTLPDQWNGIVFNNSKTFFAPDSSYASGSVLSNAIINNASRAVTLDGNTSLLIDYLAIKYSSFGIYINESGYNTIRNCNFTYCNFGIFVASGFRNPENKIYNNSIFGCSDVGIFINSNAGESNHNIISGNSIKACGIGLHIGNYGNNGPGSNVITFNVFNGNKDAIKLFHRSNSISNNYFVLNRNGILCWQSNYNDISHNLFSRNKVHAVTLSAGSSFNNITYNSMNYNSGGVWIKPDSSRNSLFNSFLYNTLYQNTDFSFQIKNPQQGAVQFNNLIRNSDYQSFQNYSDTLVHGEYNYWGTISESLIDSIIMDSNDDASFGEVLRSPILSNILTTAPVPPPQNVIKQIINNNLVVSWNAVGIADSNGYNVYYGALDGVAFEHKISNGMKTSLNLGNFPIEDTIAVTAIDLLADGTNDQTDGYESDFTFAQLYPYAGPDTAICFDNYYAINLASPGGSGILTWSTSGDGAFTNTHIINPVYIPGPQDYFNGYVVLSLSSQDAETVQTDATKITFHDAPEVFAGNDTVISLDSSIQLLTAYALGYDFVKWTTLGDGIFDSDTLINPEYTPGPEDIVQGNVRLVFTGYSACGLAHDEIDVSIDPGFSIEGRIHAGNVLAPQSQVQIYQMKNNDIQPVRSALISDDGHFKINALFAGTYYLYAIPDKTITPGYMPTYYFNDIHWENAYKLELNANTYDVDFDLVKLPLQFPAGTGSILGVCTSEPGSTEGCGEVTVLLFDKDMKNIFDWFVVRNGIDFRFKNLPFGEYILAGEEAGIPIFYSQPIILSPSDPVYENAELVCTQEGFRFMKPGENESVTDQGALSVFPNPFTDYITFSGFPKSGIFEVHIINSQGLVEKYPIQVGEIQNNTLFLRTHGKGFYIVEVWKNGTCFLRQKLVKY